MPQNLSDEYLALVRVINDFVPSNTVIVTIITIIMMKAYSTS